MHNNQSKILIKSCSEQPIQAEQLQQLYASEPWWPERSIEDISYILENHTAIGAWEGEVLIGFARAVSDCRFRAYIEDVLVLEHYRRRGIGKKLVDFLLIELGEIHVVTLFCQPRLSGYYTELGFKEFSKQVVMHLRNVR